MPAGAVLAAREKERKKERKKERERELRIRRRPCRLLQLTTKESAGFVAYIHTIHRQLSVKLH